MKHWILHRQGGQTLIQVTLAAFVLFGFLALAIDGGHVYAERRRMQNAADAGALAGARSLCAQDGTDPYVEAERYAVQNGALPRPDTSVTIVDNLVTVIARENTNTFLARVLNPGFATANVGAEAAARCGVGVIACAVLPIALQERVWDEYIPATMCGVEFWVWDDDNKELAITEELCTGEPGDPLDDYDCDAVCEVFKCNDPTVPGSPDADVLFFAGGTRGWVDFGAATDEYGFVDACGSQGCGNSELVCRIEHPYPGLVEAGDCLSSSQGVKEAARHAVEANLKGQEVQIPIYDVPCESGACSPVGYNIVEIGCVVVTDVDTVDLEPIDPVMHKRINNVKVIKVMRPCDACFEECNLLDPNDPTLPGPGDLKAVALVK